MNAADLLASAKGALAKAGEAEAEIFVRLSRRGIARFAIGELGQHSALVEPFAAVRVAKGRRVAEAMTNAVDETGLARALHEAARAAAVAPETEGFPGFAGASEPQGDDPPRHAVSTAGAGAEERVDRLAPSLRAIADAGLVSAGSLETRVTHAAVATTGGLARAHDGTLASYKVWALETAGAGGAAGFGAHVHRDVNALDIAGQTDRAIRFSTMGKDPGALPEGTYDVVMEGHAVAELVEWLATIAFGATELEQGTSALAGRIGQSITGEGVTLVEDPLDATALGLTCPFDREGVWRRRVPLIERGVARGVLYDRTHAARMGAASTGSCLPPDGLTPGGVGACAIHLDGGSAKSVEELVAGVERGLYICRLHYVNGFLEPRRAVMTGLTRDGCFRIEKGKLAGPVGNMRLTDSFLEALARCDGMTRERIAVPTWWSDAGASVVPAIRIRGLRFNGGSQVAPNLAG